MSAFGSARPGGYVGGTGGGPRSTGLGARIAALLGAIVLLIALLAMVGWLVGAAVLDSWIRGQTPMSFNAALAVAGLGAGMLLAVQPATPGRLRVSRALGLLVLLLAALTLIEYAARIDLGIDQLFVRDAASPPDGLPGRMAVQSAVALALAGAALATFHRTLSGRHVAQLLALGAGGLGYAAVLGYVYGISALATLGSPTPISLPTAVALICTAVALVMADPDHALAQQITDPGPAGQVARRVGPAALLVVPIGAWLRLVGERAGLYTDTFGLVLMVSFEALVLLLVGAWAGERVLQLERARVEAQATRDRFFDLSADGISILSPDGRFLFAGASWEHLVGYAPVDLVGHPLSDFIHDPADGSRTAAALDATRMGRDVRVIQNRFGARDGTQRWLEWTARADEDGSRIYAVARDVTERVRAEAEQARREALLREQAGLLDLAHDAILVRDLDSRVRYWNAGATETYGWTADEALGQVTHVLLRTEFPESLATVDQVLLDSGRWEGQLRHTTRDGRQIAIASRQALERDEDGAVLGILEINRDVTESVEAQDRLEEYAAALGRSNADLEQFAYVASHDLQEPLRMVTGFMSLLQKRYEGRLGPDADEYIGFAVDGARRMQVLINDLLAYSRVDSRARPFERIELGTVLDEAVTNLRATVQETGATIHRGDLPAVVGDRVQVVQLLQNLVGNALKFRRPTVPPQVWVGAERGRSEWCVYVRDDGIGIAPEHYAQIFEIFRRLHGREEYPGSGIGLAICKKIVERHGGRIWVESKPGLGATFWFSLPDRERRGDAA